MNDIDLDELHQAVSAMMSDGKKSKGKKAKTQTADSKPVAQKVPQVLQQPEKPHKETEDTHIQVNRPKPQVASRARLRGAAMDIVQPRPAGSLAPPSARAARTGASLQPTRPIASKPADSESQIQSDNSGPLEPPAPPTSQLSTSEDMAGLASKKNSDWPDPLDFHDDSTDGLPLGDAPTMMAAVRSEPAASPFVTTKVEKRPLGAYTQSSGPEQEPVTPHESQIAANREEPQPTSQPELSPEVVAIESAPAAVHHSSQTVADPADDSHHMAIPPQRHAYDQPSAQQTRPVFDTKEYHAPAQPVHAAHRTASAWGWVLIVVLVLLLAAAGVVAYFVMTGEIRINSLRLF